jgi:HD-like signal output (HDOD) protein
MIIDVSTPSAIRHISAVEAGALARVTSGAVRIPPYPAIAGKLQALAAQKRSGTHRVAAVMKTDPALTATTLGTATTRKGPLAALRRRVWREALVSAGLCEALASNRRVAHDQAFLAGLLHDFGKLVVISALEDGPTPPPKLPEADWWALVERLHVAAGLHAAREWRLAAPLTEAISEHHTPSAEIGSRRLLRLVADVDRVIAQLDTGTELDGTSGEDRTIVRAALPRIMAQIAGFEAAMPPSSSNLAAPSRVDKPVHEDAGWPVDFVVSAPRSEYRATAVWLDRLAFHGPVALRPDWIAQLVVVDRDDRLDMFAAVETCEPAGGEFRLTARPFALAGLDAAAWMRIVNRARGPRRV